MKHNVGSGDKIFRIILGLIIAALGIYYKSWWGTLAIIPFFTAAVSWCPLYLPFGLTTCKTEKESA